jgi:hypothetical protein
MPDGESDSELHRTPIAAREYTARPSARHRSARSSRRLVFFGLASIWGFIVGAAGLLAAMSVAGQPVQPGFEAIPGLIPALALAVTGGVVIAAAYRESKSRSRGD